MQNDPAHDRSQPRAQGGPSEPRFQDKRPRERKINREVLRLSGIGSGLCAVLFVVAVWVVNMVRDAHGSQLYLYLIAAVCGLVAGGIIAPYIALERADGGDAQIVTERTAEGGRADAPLEGAEQADNDREARRPTTNG